MLEPGATPDDFTLPDQDGNELAWASFRGTPVVVFFYPKANTPGCTTEACAFRDLTPEFDKRGVKLIGMSADSVRKQGNFRTKYELTMPLVADEERVVIEPWGVWQEKKMYGKTFMGIVRSTFLFDANGQLAHVWPKVKVKGHAEEVLAKVDELFGA